MSVLQCDRFKCPNIMCDKLILGGTQYICPECWEELLLYKNTWHHDISKAHIRTYIENFMNTEPGTYINLSNQEINEEFDKLTRDYE